MSKLREIQEMAEMADLIEKARALGPMTDAQRREQAASFAFGQLALTSSWRDKHADQLAELREMCRRMAGCAPSKTTICGAKSPVDPEDEDDQPVTCTESPGHAGNHAGGTRCGTITWSSPKRSTDR